MPESTHKRWRDCPTGVAWTIAGIYVIVGCLWIIGSDRMLLAMLDDPVSVTQAQTVKGWVFISATGVLIWLLTYWRARVILRSERALASAHRSLKALLGSSPAAMIGYDRDWRICAWNPAAEDLLGWKCQEVLGSEDPSLNDEQREELLRLVERAALKRPVTGMLTRRRTRSGASVEIVLSIAVLRGNDEESCSVVAVFTDAAEQQRHERLQRERRGFEDSLRAMQEAIGVIGHELRTPLASMRAMSEYLIEDCPQPADEQAAAFLKNTNEQICTMTEMVNNMLESARMTSGTARWNWAEIDLRAVMDDAVTLINPMIDTDRVTIHSAINPESLCMKGDGCALRRLLLNLLTNSLRHTTDGTITIELREVAGPDHTWINCRVEDTGRGIDPEAIDKLGRAFAANRGAIVSSFSRGAGLGLAICKEIAAVHGGRISVQSRPNRGTTFNVLLRADLNAPCTNEQDAGIQESAA